MSINRTQSNGFIARIIIALTAAAMIWWAVSAELLQGKKSSSRNWVIKVGNVEYTPHDWELSLKVASQNPISKVQYDGESLRRQVLQDLIDAAILQQEASKLEFLVSDEMAKKEIASMSMFFDKNGNFSQELLSKTIEMSGLNELEFLKKIKEQISRQQLLDFFYSTKRLLPPQFTDVLIPVIGVKNVIDIYKVDNQTLDPPNPTQDELKKYYSEHKNQFKAVEKRLISYVTIRESDLPQQQIDLKDLQKEYDAMEKKQMPETRLFQQLLFKSFKEANKQYKIFKGKPASYSTYLAKHKQSLPTILGPVSASELEPQLSTKLFVLGKNEITPPLQTPLGWHIFKVVQIKPARTETIAELKPIIEAKLRKEQRTIAFHELFEKLSDSLRNTTLQDVAKQYHLKVNNAWITNNDDITNPNKKTESKNAPNFNQDFISSVFTAKTQGISQSSVDNTLEIFASDDADNNTITLFRIEKIIPETIPNFEDIAMKVKEAYIKNDNFRAKNALAIAMKEELSRDSGLSLHQPSNEIKDIASKIKRSKIKTIEFTNIQYPKEIPQNIFNELLILREGQTTSIYLDANKNVYFAYLRKLDYSLAEENLAKYKVEASPQIAPIFNDNVFQGYLNTIRNRYKTEYRKEILLG